MEDHINSNIEPSVPLSVYQELYQELTESQRSGLGSGRKTFANISNRPSELDQPLSRIDNSQAINELPDTNKMSESIAEKTAKLHRLLGDSDKGFHLDLESPESEKLTDSVSEKEEKDIDDIDDEKDYKTTHNTIRSDSFSSAVKRRPQRTELPSGWEKHQVTSFILVSLVKLKIFLTLLYKRRRITPTAAELICIIITSNLYLR